MEEDTDSQNVIKLVRELLQTVKLINIYEIVVYNKENLERQETNK